MADLHQVDKSIFCFFEHVIHISEHASAYALTSRSFLTRTFCFDFVPVDIFSSYLKTIIHHFKPTVKLGFILPSNIHS